MNKPLAISLAVLTFGVGGCLGAILFQPKDPCRDLANVSGQAMRLNTDILNATTDFLKADTAGDASGMVDASDRLTTATNSLGALKSQYSTASEKCNAN